MNATEQLEWDAFERSGLADLWRWLVGGLPRHLGTGLTAEVVENFFSLLVETVQAGASHEDLLKLRQQLTWRLVQEAAGRRRRGPS